MARWMILSALVLAVASPASAKDFGTMGPMFPIVEPSLLDSIHARLSDMEQSGDLETWRRQMETTTRDYVNRPRPVSGLAKATEYARFEIDLSITLERDLADHKGRVFARAGTRVNPLGYSRFNKRIVVLLVFF